MICAATAVLKIRVSTGSAKIRAEGVGDLKADLQNPDLDNVWSGVIPIKQLYGVPEQDSDATPLDTLPQHISDLIKQQ